MRSQFFFKSFKVLLGVAVCLGIVYVDIAQASGGGEGGGNAQSPVQVIVQVVVTGIILNVLSRFNLP